MNPGDRDPYFFLMDDWDGLDLKGKEGRVLWELTGRRLYSRKNRCRKLTIRKIVFQTITSRLHLYRVAHTMKNPHPVPQQRAVCGHCDIRLAAQYKDHANVVLGEPLGVSLVGRTTTKAQHD